MYGTYGMEQPGREVRKRMGTVAGAFEDDIDGVDVILSRLLLAA